MADSPDISKAPRPTLKTIARMTGLAVATVSRALHDADDLSAETKKRVREAAAKVGYRPNRAGVRLRTGKTNVISLVLSTDHDLMNHTARLISSIAGAFRNTAYHLIITPYFADEDPMDPVRYIVETGSADAVILNQTTPDDPRVAYLMEKAFPFATHGRTQWCDRHAYFDFDNTAFAHMAVAELHAQGRGNILLILPPLLQNYSMNLMDGAAEASQVFGVKTTVLQGATSDDPSDLIEAATRQFLADNPDIDAILCASTISCMAATAAAENLGRVLGQDIDIAAKEAVSFLKQFRQPILTLNEDVAKAGAFLARATMQAIAKPEAAPMQFLDAPTKVG